MYLSAKTNEVNKMDKEEVVIEIGEWCNKIITNEKGTWLYFDKSLLGEVVELLEGKDE